MLATVLGNLFILLYGIYSISSPSIFVLDYITFLSRVVQNEIRPGSHHQNEYGCFTLNSLSLHVL